ncbi:MAG: hypothetical protein ABIP94_19905 [Planctomycetota bacterium]
MLVLNEDEQKVPLDAVGPKFGLSRHADEQRSDEHEARDRRDQRHGEPLAEQQGDLAHGAQEQVLERAVLDTAVHCLYAEVQREPGRYHCGL